MNLSLPIRSVRPSIGRSSPSSTFFQQCRQESTRRRQTQKLRIPPAPSFESGQNTQDHIIFNPPSSAPNVHHTPVKFLPKNDPRRALFTADMTSTPAASSSRTQSPILMNKAPRNLPPPIAPIHKKRYHLQDADVEEMRRLRAEDPRQWTQKALSEKFDCSLVFVRLMCQNAQAHAEHKAMLEKARSKWGRRKWQAYEDAKKRRLLWGQDA